MVRIESGRSEPTDSKLEKSCLPTRACAAVCIASASSGVGIVPGVVAVEDRGDAAGVDLVAIGFADGVVSGVKVFAGLPRV